MSFHRPRGTQDLLPSEAALWRRVTDSMGRRLESYGYGEMRTPVSSRPSCSCAASAPARIVQKEMYTFNDRKDAADPASRRNGPGVRAILENNLLQEAGIQRFWYLESM